jgi:hypothetical protein
MNETPHLAGFAKVINFDMGKEEDLTEAFDYAKKALEGITGE